MKKPITRNERRELERLQALQRELRLRSGSIELDRVSRQVTVDGEPVHLRPQHFAMLELLLLHKGEVLDRDTILAALFPEKTPTYNFIAWCLSTLHDVLGDAFPVQHLRGEGYTIPRDEV